MGLLKGPQGPALLLGRHRGRVRGDEVIQPGPDHLHGLGGTGEDRDGTHWAARLPPAVRAGQLPWLFLTVLLFPRPG